MAGRPFASFAELSDATKAVLAAGGFERATPVQEATIPLFAGNKDVAVEACTGSGKTLAFVVPIVEKLRKLDAPLKRHQVGAVVVSPTRELSRQIFDVAAPFAASLPWLRAALLVGGTDPSADVAALRATGAHLLVGTPGRLDDILQRCPFLDLKTVEVLVLDEADRLLDMGFKAQLDSLMGRLPRQRRTGLFSATQTEAVEALARAGLRNPVRVAVAVTAAPQPSSTKRGADGGDAAGEEGGGKRGKGGSEAQHAAQQGGLQAQVTPDSLRVMYAVVPTEDKLPALAAFLAGHAAEKTIVYFLTCACVDFAAAALPRVPGAGAGLHLHPLHGRMKQGAREATLAAFAAASAGVLLATDVAARGLDIPDVHWVVQADAPQDPAAFVHRCGRTARMGRSGSALAFLTPTELPYVDFLRLRRVPLTEAPPGLTAAPGGGFAAAARAALRKESESDRAVMEAGVKAFVSYIRAYKEHHCRYIFRLEDLPLGHLATGFALLRLPRMPEAKKAARAAAAGELEGFAPSAVDPESVRFRDKAREKQRQAVLKQRAAAAAAAEAAGAKVKGAGKKGERREAAPPAPRLTAAKRRQLEARQELAELNDEYALLRKLKKGKISQREYDVAAGLSSDEESGGGGGGGGGGKEKKSGGETLARVGAHNLVEEAVAKKARKKARKERARAAKAGGGGAGP